MKSIRLIAILAIGAMSSILGCARVQPSPGLVNTLELGTVRGFHLERVITHFHLPYSFDACDSKGQNADGSLNLNCLHDAKSALCNNHINLTFATDHTNFVAATPFQNLLYLETGDVPVLNGTSMQVGNQVTCPDGFGAVISPGLEGQLLALGMEQHVTENPYPAGTPFNLANIYGGNSTLEQGALADTVANGGAHALVGIPHTESRDNALLQTLNPTFIEIYNLHANLDPKIRKTSLGLPPFEHIAKFMNYLLDPFNSQNADYMFIEFFEMAPVYFQKWNTLLAGGMHVTGVAGHDSHENIFPQKASDGERLDQHRRMIRMFSNLIMTTASDIDTIKASITAGKVYFVLEGLGSPLGLDFHGTLAGSTIVEMGSTMTVGAGQSSSLSFGTPSVISSFPGMDSGLSPIIYSELHFISATGAESVVASAVNAPLIYVDPPAGNYRIHSYMYPFHLRELVLKHSYAEKAYPWIISNPILVVR